MPRSNASAFSFLRSRTVAFWIAIIVLPVWIIGLLLHYQARQNHSPLSTLNRMSLLLVLVTCSISFSTLIFAGLLQKKSREIKQYLRVSTVAGELIMLGVIFFLQIIGSIALTTRTPHFPCPASDTDPLAVGNCRTFDLFIMVTSWTIDAIETFYFLHFAVLTLRVKAHYPLIWNTLVWVVEWENMDVYKPPSVDVEKASTISIPQSEPEEGEIIHTEVYRVPLTPNDRVSNPDIPEWLRYAPAVTRAAPEDRELPRYSIVFPSGRRSRTPRAASRLLREPRTPTPPYTLRTVTRYMVEIPASIAQLPVPRLQPPPQARTYGAQQYQIWNPSYS